MLFSHALAKQIPHAQNRAFGMTIPKGYSTYGSFHLRFILVYSAVGNCTSIGPFFGSSHPSTASNFSCGIAVQPTVPCPGPRHMCMKMHDPLPGWTGLALWSTTIPQRYSSSLRRICSELCQSGLTELRSRMRL